MPIADLNDIKMYYEIVGESCHVPLIMVPGLRGDSLSFGNIVPQLKRYSQLIMLDNRGAGRTLVNGESFTTDQMAGDIISLMDYLDIGKANILGHSMGGFIVQKLASGYQDRVNKIILSCCSPLLTEKSREILTELYEERKSFQITHREFNKRMLKFFSAPLIYESDFMCEAMLDFMEEYPYKQSFENFKKQLDACVNHNGTEDLKKISSKTLVLGGDLDTVAGIKDINKLVAGINRSELKMIEGVGHLPFVEDSKKFVKIVVDFLFK